MDAQLLIADCMLSDRLLGPSLTAEEKEEFNHSLNEARKNKSNFI